ncbi:hypothetical protein FHE66_14755 [Georgenia sp. 311]|uniref:hypothetical protein n=1 Tax=Georgenia sp. 311 TaxID=2585134 RepID=UPI001112C1A9|nr:hypothetical protein [Georgenia sp. 311]TNC16631.1 hypothetical protein FHE66_14755 [Georgenia sp. 311]
MDLFAQPGAPRLRFDVDTSACDLDDLAPCGGVDVTVGGDVAWADLVQRAVTSAWPGVERLGGYGGTVADVVRENAEADGQAVADVVASVTARDLTDNRTRGFAFTECAFGPGTSRFQERLPGGRYRYDVLEVAFLFQLGDLTTPIRDPELAAVLGVEPGGRVPIAEYAARRGIRRG